MVERGDLALLWSPSSTAGPDEVHRSRSAASGRAHDVELDLRVEGPVALWSHRDLPVLATAALVDPERMLRRITAAGLAMTPDVAPVSAVGAYPLGDPRSEEAGGPGRRTATPGTRDG